MSDCHSCLLAGAKNSALNQCPFRGTALAFQRHNERLPCGSVLNGKYIVGPPRDTSFAHSYYGVDWYGKRKVMIWEFFPYRHARREAGSPQVAYHKCGLVPDGEPAGDPAYWMDKYASLNDLLLKLSSGPAGAFYPAWYDYFGENNTAYIVTELVEGETLEEYLKSMGGTVAWLEAMRLLSPAVGALSGIHRENAVHGGLTPDRIILTPDGEIRLTDIGAEALWIDYTFQTADDAPLDYWQPYRYHSVFLEGVVTDIYSLACCYYRAVAGTPPGKPGPLRQSPFLPIPEGKNGCFPAEAERVLHKALRFSPTDFLTVEEFWRDMEAVACR